MKTIQLKTPLVTRPEAEAALTINLPEEILVTAMRTVGGQRQTPVTFRVTGFAFVRRQLISNDINDIGSGNLDPVTVFAINLLSQPKNPLFARKLSHEQQVLTIGIRVRGTKFDVSPQNFLKDDASTRLTETIHTILVNPEQLGDDDAAQAIREWAEDFVESNQEVAVRQADSTGGLLNFLNSATE